MKVKIDQVKSKKAKSKNGFVPTFFFCLFTFYFSCTTDPEPTLNYQDREIVDSLFRVEVERMKPVIDSLCEMRYDSAVQFKVDSMTKVRQSEIERYLERIKREEGIE